MYFQTDGHESRDYTYLMKVLGQHEYSFTTSGECESVRENFEAEMTNAITSDVVTNYELPDGQVIAIDMERFRCAHCLFKSSLIGKQSQNIHSLTYDNIIRFIRIQY